MFEKDFIFIMYDSYEKLVNQKKELKSKKKFYEQTDSKNSELKNIEYQLMILDDQIKITKEVIDFPRYARIKAMSDAEVENYQQEKINIFKVLIDELSFKIKKTRKNKINLKLEQNDCALRYAANDDEDEKKEFIKKGLDIKKAIDECDQKIQKYNEQIEKYNEQKTALNNSSLSELKNELLKNSNFDADKLTDLISTVPFLKILSSVAGDYEKSKELSDLLIQYNKQCNIYATIDLEKISSIIEKYTPELLFDEENAYKNIHILYNCIRDKKETLKEKETFFNSIYTKDKLMRLVDAKDGKVDINDTFVMQFADAFSDENELDRCKELEDLKENLIEKSKIKHNFLFRKIINSQIEDIDNEINDLKEIIFNKILSFYILKSNEYGLESPSFNDYNSIDTFLTSAKKYFDEQYNIFNEELNLLKLVHDDYIINGQKIKNERENLLKNINDLTGENVKLNDIDLSLISDSVEDNLKLISLSSALYYRVYIMDVIYHQATDLANVKEAELKGITIEELLKQKNNDGYQKVKK